MQRQIMVIGLDEESAVWFQPYLVTDSEDEWANGNTNKKIREHSEDFLDFIALIDQDDAAANAFVVSAWDNQIKLSF